MPSELEEGLQAGANSTTNSSTLSSGGDVRDALLLRRPQPIVFGGGGNASDPPGRGSWGSAADADGDVDQNESSNRSSVSSLSKDTMWSEASDTGGTGTPSPKRAPVPYSPAFKLLEETAPDRVLHYNNYYYYNYNNNNNRVPSRSASSTPFSGNRMRGVSGRSSLGDDDGASGIGVGRQGCHTSCAVPRSPSSSPNGASRRKDGIGGGSGGGGVDRCYFGVSLAFNVLLSVAAAMCAVLYINELSAVTPVQPEPHPSAVRRIAARRTLLFVVLFSFFVFRALGPTTRRAIHYITRSSPHNIVCLCFPLCMGVLGRC
jgi:hypothetical protein